MLFKFIQKLYVSKYFSLKILLMGLLFLFGSVSIYATQPSPIANFPIQSNMVSVDITGNGNSAFAYGPGVMTVNRFGHENSAYFFNSDVEETDYFIITSEVGAQAKSISAWVKHDDSKAFQSWEAILGGTCGTPYLSLSGGKPTFGAQCGSPVSHLSSSSVLSAGWHHIVGVYDGSTAELYVDGVLENSWSASGSFSIAPLAIGASLDGNENPTEPFNGAIDEVLIYDVALIQSEILTLFNDGKEANLLAYYPVAGDPSLDAYGKYDGTLSGSGNLADDQLGNSASAYYFAGDSSVELGSSFTSQIRSITAWVKADTSVSFQNWEDILAGYCGTPLFSLHGGKPGFGGQCNQPFSFIEDTNVLDNNWHHLAGVYDGQTASMYVDGQLVASQAASGSFSQAPIAFGSGLDGADNPYEFFQGTLDEVRIYSSPLSAGDVAELYEKSHPNPLIAYYPIIHETPENDVSGGLNDGTLSIGTGEIVSDRLNDPDSAYQFNGDGSIELNDSISPQVKTIMAWVKADNSDGYQTYEDIVGGYCGTPLFTLHSGKPSFGGQCNQPFARAESTTALDGNWHHLAGVYDGQTAKLYVDGLEIASQAATGNFITAPIAIGSGLNSAGDPFEFFDGMIDEVKIYREPLSAADVQQEMQNSSRILLHPGQTTAYLENSITGYWHSSSGNTSGGENPRFRLVVDTAGTVELNLKSENDTVLYLLDQNDVELASNDEAYPNSLNSKITTTLNPGEYTLVAATDSSGQVGDFVITTNHGRLYYPYDLELKWHTNVGNDDFIYHSVNLGSARPVSIWKTLASQSPGYYSLGNYALPWHDYGTSPVLLVKDVGDVLTPPASIQAVWNDSGSGASGDITIYRLIPQSGYTCLGNVAVASYTASPDLSGIRCIKSQYLVPGTYRDLWDDHGSGANADAQVYMVEPDHPDGIGANTFISTTTYGAPGSLDQYWTINQAAVKPASFTETQDYLGDLGLTLNTTGTVVNDRDCTLSQGAINELSGRIGVSKMRIIACKDGDNITFTPFYMDIPNESTDFIGGAQLSLLKTDVTVEDSNGLEHKFEFKGPSFTPGLRPKSWKSISLWRITYTVGDGNGNSVGFSSGSTNSPHASYDDGVVSARIPYTKAGAVQISFNTTDAQQVVVKDIPTFAEDFGSAVITSSEVYIYDFIGLLESGSSSFWDSISFW